MSAIQTAAANTVLRIANLFEQNCALKHGLPKVGGPDRVEDQAPAVMQTNSENVSVTRTETTTADTVTDSPSPGEGAAAVTSSSLWRRAAPLLLTTFAAVGIPTYLLLTKQQPAAAPSTVPIIQPAENKDGDLLQWLQSQGKHLPEGTWQTK